METETIRTSLARVGNFTSSEIVALMACGVRQMTEEELSLRPKKGVGSRTTQVDDLGSFGPAALTYIEECNWERNLGRCLETESGARPLTWGKLCEGHVFELLGTEYQECFNKTLVHPTYDFWAGSPDAKKFDEGKTVGEIKCPMTLRSFCQLVECIYKANLSGLNAMNYIRIHHKDGEKYYWQIVSNGILTDSQHGELIVYAPYRRELEEIRDVARKADGAAMAKLYWVVNSSDDELPWLIEGGRYRNINVIRFEIPVADKQLLIDRVRLGGKMLDKSF